MNAEFIKNKARLAVIEDIRNHLEEARDYYGDHDEDRTKPPKDDNLRACWNAYSHYMDVIDNMMDEYAYLLPSIGPMTISDYKRYRNPQVLVDKEILDLIRAIIKDYSRINYDHLDDEKRDNLDIVTDYLW